MRFTTILPLLLATAFASSDSSAEASSESPKAEEPTPAGEVWLAKWKDSDLSSYTKKCEGSTTFKANIYTLGEMYPTLKEWAPQLKVFYNKQLYPGSWEGKDAHGDKRELLKMPYEELPFAVREWYVAFPFFAFFFSISQSRDREQGMLTRRYAGFRRTLISDTSPSKMTSSSSPREPSIQSYLSSSTSPTPHRSRIVKACTRTWKTTLRNRKKASSWARSPTRVEERTRLKSLSKHSK